MQNRRDWEGRLGFSLHSDLSLELEGRQAAPDDPSFFVYLCGGNVDEVRPSNSVTLTPDQVVLMYGKTPVASYPRSDVLFCSQTGGSPFPS
jgi:hypothetical protein